MPTPTVLSSPLYPSNSPWTHEENTVSRCSTALMARSLAGTSWRGQSSTRSPDTANHVSHLSSLMASMTCKDSCFRDGNGTRSKGSQRHGGHGLSRFRLKKRRRSPCRFDLHLPELQMAYSSGWRWLDQGWPKISKGPKKRPVRVWHVWAWIFAIVSAGFTGCATKFQRFVATADRPHKPPFQVDWIIFCNGWHGAFAPKQLAPNTTRSKGTENTKITKRSKCALIWEHYLSPSPTQRVQAEGEQVTQLNQRTLCYL